MYIDGKMGLRCTAFHGRGPPWHFGRGMTTAVARSTSRQWMSSNGMWTRTAAFTPHGSLQSTENFQVGLEPYVSLPSRSICEASMSAYPHSKFVNFSEALLLEESVVDPRQRLLTSTTRNLTYPRVLQVHETRTFRAGVKDDTTRLRVHATFLSNVRWKPVAERVESYSWHAFRHGTTKVSYPASGESLPFPHELFAELGPSGRSFELGNARCIDAFAMNRFSGNNCADSTISVDHLFRVVAQFLLNHIELSPQTCCAQCALSRMLLAPLLRRTSCGTFCEVAY